jgi:hypothetical protein
MSGRQIPLADDELPEDSSTEPTRPLTEAEQAELAEFDARGRERQLACDSTYRQLLLDAQASARSMLHSPQLNSTEDWEATVTKALVEYRSGRSLMDQLGADRLLDAPTAGMLLAIRRSLIEETSATSAGEMVLIDMAVIAYANAMRFQSMIGNTALVLEAEMFGQPSLRAKWKKKYGARPEDISGLAVEEHVARLRDKLLPLVEKSHRIARESIEAISRLRQAPSLSVERSEAIGIVLVPIGKG